MNAFEFVLGILFFVVVMPIWLIAHYNHKSKKIRGLDEDDRKDLEQLLINIDEMTDRIDVLESIVYEKDKKNEVK